MLTTKIFTFWLGPMPAYIRMCLQTFSKSGYDWVLLDHSNMNEFIPRDELPVERLMAFPPAAQGDIVAVYMMNRYRGYFIDADTVFFGSIRYLEELLDSHELVMVGDENVPFCHAAFILGRGDSLILREWKKRIDELLAVFENPGTLGFDGMYSGGVKPTSFGNPLLAPLIRKWTDRVKILDKDVFLPENLGLVDVSPEGRKRAYVEYYFSENSQKKPNTHFLVLHNSWTPDWYKLFRTEDIQKDGCFLSRLLAQAIR
ncbi:hypothetical protein J0A68_20835 [Algoriphagus sp. H41]|uniref:Glycosyltransferase sugar-binding region containing DXD motif-containing protein n=1 Tax=Algoriphagus oliviformis TaxID=2811231 RepID=A0ABS3CCP5_9BACT|nr:hypothetical protein [Algoriphagus oliviformis]MBN7813414.1 hypothetical protein [Algoriphagus oliviformis]